MPATRHFLRHKNIAFRGQLLRAHRVVVTIIQEYLVQPLVAPPPDAQDQVMAARARQPHDAGAQGGPG